MMSQPFQVDLGIFFLEKWPFCFGQVKSISLLPVIIGLFWPKTIILHKVDCLSWVISTELGQNQVSLGTWIKIQCKGGIYGLWSNCEGI